jgi:prophage regulatory protein
VRRDRLLRIHQVEDLIGAKKSTIYNLMRTGQFVQPVRISARCVAWPESAVLQWVQDRITAARVPA